MLQRQWDKATGEAGSASVTIVNEVDGEEVPSVPEDFQYMERGYDWGAHVPDAGFLAGCHCVDRCGAQCSCVGSIDGDPMFEGFWYDKEVRSL